MDHPNQNTMLLPASYAVISEEEMTYLDGGQSIYLGSAFNHDIYFNTDQFATFCPEKEKGSGEAESRIKRRKETPR